MIKDRLLVTQSLLSAWQYQFDCYDYEEAHADFLRTLRREPNEEPTQAMLDGIEFENEVYAAAKGLPRKPHKKWERGIQQVAAIIRGAAVQVRIQRDIRVDHQNFLLYGIADAVRAGVIYDVKFSSKGFGSREMAGNWLDSPQHPVYMYCVPEAEEFKYVCSDGDDLYTETYSRADTPDIRETLSNFMKYLELERLMDEYRLYWTAD